jgi:signal transduction histidine kinase
VTLLQTFADQAVIAIENVRLFTELQQKNRALTEAHAQVTEALEQQTATSEILRTIAHVQTDAQPVFDTIVQSAARLCHGAVTGLFLTDGQMVYLPANYGGSADALAANRARFPRPLDMETPPGVAMLMRSVVHVGDTEDPSAMEYVRQAGRLLGFRSGVTVPMLREGEAVGAIAVTRREPGRFSDSEVALLKTFADQAVIAIENARLLTALQARTQELTRSVEQLTALGDVGRAVSSTLDLETVLTTIVSRAVELSGLDGGVVFEYDGGAEEFVHRVATQAGGALAAARRATRIRKGEGAVGRTALTLAPAQVADITVPGAYESRLRENLIESGIRAVLAVPMVREGELIGCLVVTRNRPGEFTADAIELLRTFATQSALAIQNARLFREIELKSRELEAASRHKSEFLANMSHELRTPLNAIIGFSEVLRERLFGELNDKQDEYMKDIHASGQHLLSLINDILDLSKIEAGRMELEIAAFHLPTAIENALTLVRERAGRRSLTLQATVDERLGEVHGDARKVKQVLLNLLSNAIKFTPEGGRVEVRAASVDGLAEISVRDTGVGIAPEDQGVVFEEFRQVGTADKKVEGTGLGLALSRKSSSCTVGGSGSRARSGWALRSRSRCRYGRRVDHGADRPQRPPQGSVRRGPPGRHRQVLARDHPARRADGGRATLTALVVTGPLVCSVVLDHYGWVGFTEHAAGIDRILGCLLMMAGFFLIARF